MAAAVMTPLTPDEEMRKTARDGRPMADVAASFIAPNSRLTAFERLELYNRQYWLRILGSLAEDFMGLRALLGGRQIPRAVGCVSLRTSQPFLHSAQSRLQPGGLVDRASPVDGPPSARSPWTLPGSSGRSLRLLTTRNTRRSPSNRLPLSTHPRGWRCSPMCSCWHSITPLMMWPSPCTPVRRDKRARLVSRTTTIRQPRCSCPESGADPHGLLHTALTLMSTTAGCKKRSIGPWSRFANGSPLADALDSGFAESTIAESRRPHHVQKWFATWAELGWLCAPDLEQLVEN